MLYEFAMTPDLFDGAFEQSDESAKIIIIQILRGIAENGLLANLNKESWLNHVYKDRIVTLSQSLKDKVLSCLSTLQDRHRIVRHQKRINNESITDIEWLNLALEYNNDFPFQAIITSPQLLSDHKDKNDSLVEFFGALDSSKWLESRKRSLTLNKTKDQYRSALTPVLRYAKTLILIDPWINSQESRYFDTVAICSNLMGQRGYDRIKGRIDIHANFEKQKFNGHETEEMNTSKYLDNWEIKLNPLIKNDGHKFRIFLWKLHPNSETMKERYIITDQCVISLSGLDCRSDSHANTTHWKLLDDLEPAKCLENYREETSPYKLLGNREIS